MRILKIRLSNINSLQGDWEIDFTSPEYTNNGIFAISGPTGAGKSTILDAISLALYACTPRINSITQASNEVMSRGTYDCNAELVFMAASKTYKAVFRHHRAKSGKLQPVSHLLYEPDGDNWRAVTQKKTETLQRIIAITGMDFEQFTRSMLLAQGNFSAFLKAKGDERAKALEKITGTEIYSEISVRALERKREQEETLRALNAKLDGVVLLSDEERSNYISQQGQLQTLEKATKLRQCSLTESKAWLTRLSELDQSLVRARSEQSAAQAAHDAAASKRTELQAARQAASIAVDHANLLSAQKQLADLQKKQSELTELRSRLQQQCDDHLPLQTAAKVAFETARTTLTTNRELFKCVRAKDIECKAARASVLDANTSADQAATLFGKTTLDVVTAEKAIKAEQRKLEALQTKLKAYSHFASLPENIGTIRALADTLSASDQELAEAKKTDGLRDKALSDSLAALQAKENNLKRILAARQNDQIEYEKRQKTLQAALDGKTRSVWDKASQTVSRHLLTLEQLHEACLAQRQARKNLEDNTANLELSEQQLSGLQKDLAKNESQLQAHRTAVESLEKTIEMLTQIQRYATDRASLSDGHPCPLCGSTSHPYVGQLLETPDDSAQKLVKQKQALKQCAEEAVRITQKSATLRGEIQALHKNTETIRIQVSQATQKCQGLLATLPEGLAVALVDENGTILQEQCEQLSIRLKHQAAEVEARLERIDTLQTELATLQEALSAHADLHTKLETEKNQAQLSVACAQSDKRASEAELVRMHERQVAARDKLMLVMRDYVQPPEAIAGLETLQLCKRVEKLQAECKTYLEISAGVATHEAHLQTLGARLEGLINAKASAQSSLANAQALCKQKQDLLNQRLKERRELFEDKDVDTEEQLQTQAVTQAEEAWKKAQDSLQQAQKSLEDTLSQSKLTDSNIVAATAARDAASSAWITARSRLFASDQAWLEACRTPEVMQSLTKQTELLEKALTEKIAQVTQLHNSLKIERQKALTQASLPTVEAELEQVNRTLDETQQRLGSLCQQLRHDDEQKQRFADQSREISKHKDRLRIWTTLYDLIGSSDGKKYRNFVQQLTFGTLVQYANQELVKLTKRYTLKPGGTDGLELNIIDHYRADAERATDNLSGGESFIVSLALALGLSKMAAKNVRIDSLFLDEGFGTLDADTLETALNVLASLNSEGKLIGIISHVGEIRERIPIIISVEPIAGGISKISGPGVSLIQN